MPAFLSLILRMLVGLGGGAIAGRAASGLAGSAAKRVGTSIATRLGRPTLQSLGARPDKLSLLGRAGRSVQESLTQEGVASSLGGLPGFAGGLAGFIGTDALLFGPEGADPEQAAQMQHASPGINALQSQQLDAIEQEALVRRALDEMGIDFDDLQSRGGGGGLI